MDFERKNLNRLGTIEFDQRCSIFAKRQTLYTILRNLDNLTMSLIKLKTTPFIGPSAYMKKIEMHSLMTNCQVVLDSTQESIAELFVVILTACVPSQSLLIELDHCLGTFNVGLPCWH